MKEPINVCVSGGAEGSDLLWGDLAIRLSHELYHVSFKGHRIDLIDSLATEDNVFVLDENRLRMADSFLKRANRILRRKFPTNSGYVNNLLRRNWYQVRLAERIYAIGDLKGNIVQGGTGWAVQMFLDKMNVPMVFDVECFVLNKNDYRWYVWKTDEFKSIDMPPTPHGRWAGIGSRDIDRQVIEMVNELE